MKHDLIIAPFALNQLGFYGMVLATFCTMQVLTELDLGGLFKCH